MPELPRISGAEAIKAFRRAGFEKKRQRGSHVVLKKEGFPMLLSVPLHKELDRGILRVCKEITDHIQSCALGRNL